MATDPTRHKTTREREIDELLDRGGHPETAEQIYRRIREAGGTRTEVIIEIKNLTGATISPKSMAAWWDTEPDSSLTLESIDAP